MLQACGDETSTTRGALTPDELYGSCADSCGFQSQDGICWCDDLCEQYGDCCEDLVEVCEGTNNCESADEPIACPAVYELCDDVYEPVCGCDGQTYANACELGNACVTLSHEGECEIQGCPDIWAPVCGVDGNTYGNDCEANNAGVPILHEGECESVPGEYCGGLGGFECDEGQYCDYEPGDYCGAADALGTCREIPEACTLVDEPVCGCDGQTYSNECLAANAGIGIFDYGACEPPPLAECGGFAGIECPDGEICQYYGGADFGYCVPDNESCSLYYEPVCGIDGITYSNECFAGLAGVGILGYGECEDVLPPPGENICNLVDCQPGATCEVICFGDDVGGEDGDIDMGAPPFESCYATCIPQDDAPDMLGSPEPTDAL